MNYREGISRSAEVRYVHKKQSGGSGQFADVAVRFEPGEVRQQRGVRQAGIGKLGYNVWQRVCWPTWLSALSSEK